MSRPLVVGNWKMNGDGAWLDRISAIAATATSAIEIVLCLPATLVHRAASLDLDLTIGGQDCHTACEGAYTGAVSAAMLHEAGARTVIVGHSERRQAGDDDAMIAAKIVAAQAAGLGVILCVGEDAAARAAGDAVDIVARQVRIALTGSLFGNLIVAYEPVWAIGRGIVPAADEIAAVVAGLCATLADLGFANAPVLYGGSVTARRVPSLMADGVLSGLLVGQASLNPETFAGIAEAVRRTRCLV